MRPYIQVASLFLGLLFAQLGLGQRCGVPHRPPSEIPAVEEHDILTRGNLTVPLVFHVLYTEDADSLTDQQIASQIEVLNEDYGLFHPYLDDIPSAFEEFASATGISFCLAKRDPHGLPTNGINRKRTDIEEIGMTNRFYQSALGGIDPWPTEDYVNVYVSRLSGDLLGFSTFPYSNEPYDAVVIQPQFIGRGGSAQGPHDLGRTLTHELGHYFGLEHLWGPGQGGCQEDDLVEDTPPQETENKRCPAFPVRDLCSPQPPGVMFMNYMDFTDDRCMSFFTQGQAERMMAMIEEYRSELFKSNACTPVSTSSEVAESLSYRVYIDRAASYIHLIPKMKRAGLHGGRAMIISVEGYSVLSKEVTLGQEILLNVDGLLPGPYSLILTQGRDIAFSYIFVYTGTH